MFSVSFARSSAACRRSAVSFALSPKRNLLHTTAIRRDSPSPTFWRTKLRLRCRFRRFRTKVYTSLMGCLSLGRVSFWRAKFFFGMYLIQARLRRGLRVRGGKSGRRIGLSFSKLWFRDLVCPFFVVRVPRCGADGCCRNPCAWDRSDTRPTAFFPPSAFEQDGDSIGRDGYGMFVLCWRFRFVEIDANCF